MNRMLRPPHARRLASGWLWAGIVLLLLGGCGGLQVEPPPVEPGPSTYAYVATLDITEADAPAEVAARYGVEIVTWLPEAGFAIVGLYDAPVDFALLSTAEPNEDVFGVEDEEAEALGVSAWAGGVSAWAGGVSAWAGGVSAWAGGTANPFPGNDRVWEQIGLGEAQELAAARGQDVVVAVIDTGVDLLHLGIQGRLTPSHTWLDLVGKGNYPHEDVLQTSGKTSSTGIYFGHGTAAAGIILQAAPNALIMPIRVLATNGRGNVSDIAMAIDHAVRNGASVINLSLGTVRPVRAIESMIRYANSQGVMVIASSGNSGDSKVTFPASAAGDPQLPKLLGVGSVDADDRKSAFSTFGTNLAMLAPGAGITTLFPGNTTAVVSGTSFAAPWVSGTVALALGEGAAMPARAVLEASTPIDALNPSFAGLLGYGRLDAHAALTSALGAP